MEQWRSTSQPGAPVGRRVFLGLLGLGAAGILLGAQAQDWLEREVGPLIAKDGTGLASLLPIGRFRIYTVTGDLPSRSRADYRLQVKGLVDQPLTLSYADIVAMQPTALTRDFQCVTGWRVHDVAVEGRAPRRRARPRRRAARGAARCASRRSTARTPRASRSSRPAGATCSSPTSSKATPLSDEHGGPVRLYVAPMYGYKSLKWLDSHRAHRRTCEEGYWEVRGYDVDGWVGRSNGRDDDAT